ncbi:MAG: CDP-glucose 4,6-dehydratase [Holosporales bacterium]|jgi:CDP-glucose 4,6-dehydratase|nr:CDP-glucose 4,6-dehydratase [Holosporales bacterium]
MGLTSELGNFYSGKKVFITGHTGFKGSWLSFWLISLGAEVVGYALEPEHEDSLFTKLRLKNKLWHNVADIRDFSSLSSIIDRAKPDLVFHLAAQSLVKRSYDDPVTTFNVNVIGSVNLLESVRKCPSVRSLIYITSDKCYANNEWVWGYRENDALGGTDPYSASKACAEHVFRSYFLSYFVFRNEFGCASTRAGNVIGGGDVSENRIVPDIIKAISNNQSIVLKNPNSTRPWQHVLDPLHGYMQLGSFLYTHPEIHNGEAWNFGPNSNSIKTVYELTKLLTEKLDKLKIERSTVDEQYQEASLLHLSIEKAQSLLNWQPKFSFDEAVTKTAHWYKRVKAGDDPIEVTIQQLIEFTRV